jgi:hypothetical protein
MELTSRARAAVPGSTNLRMTYFVSSRLENTLVSKVRRTSSSTWRRCDFAVLGGETPGDPDRADQRTVGVMERLPLPGEPQRAGLGDLDQGGLRYPTSRS